MYQNRAIIGLMMNIGTLLRCTAFLGIYLHAMHVVHMNYNFIKPAWINISITILCNCNQKDVAGIGTILA